MSEQLVSQRSQDRHIVGCPQQVSLETFAWSRLVRRCRAAAAKHVVIKVRNDIACPPGQFFMWGVGGVFRFATGLGETNRVWIVDVNGTRFWFEAETYKGASPELDQEIQGMVDSIQFE